MEKTTTPLPTINLPCPHCGEAGASIRLHLSSATFVCDECDNEISEKQVEEAILNFARWRQVFAWQRQMPGGES